MSAGVLKEYEEPAEIEVEGETEEVSTFRGSEIGHEEHKDAAAERKKGKATHDEDSMECDVSN